MQGKRTRAEVLSGTYNLHMHYDITKYTVSTGNAALTVLLHGIFSSCLWLYDRYNNEHRLSSETTYRQCSGDPYMLILLALHVHTGLLPLCSAVAKCLAAQHWGKHISPAERLPGLPWSTRAQLPPETRVDLAGAALEKGSGRRDAREDRVATWKIASRKDCHSGDKAWKKLQEEKHEKNKFSELRLCSSKARDCSTLVP